MVVPLGQISGVNLRYSVQVVRFARWTIGVLVVAVYTCEYLLQDSSLELFYHGNYLVPHLIR